MGNPASYTNACGCCHRLSERRQLLSLQTTMILAVPATPPSRPHLLPADIYALYAPSWKLCPHGATNFNTAAPSSSVNDSEGKNEVTKITKLGTFASGLGIPC